MLGPHSVDLPMTILLINSLWFLGKIALLVLPMLFLYWLSTYRQFSLRERTVAKMCLMLLPLLVVGGVWLWLTGHVVAMTAIIG